MRDFLGVGENCPKWWDYSCSKMQNNRYRLLLPLGRYSRSKFGTQRNDETWRNDGRLGHTAYSLWSKAFLIIFCVLFSGFLGSPAYGQEAEGLTQSVVRGVVSSVVDGKPIEGASVTVDKKHTRTDKEGRFTIRGDKPTGVLLIKHIGYKEQRVAYENTATILNIALQTGEKQIEEVEVVSTGYQKIPKERATGSFEFIDSALFNRKVSTDFVSRLEDVVPGLSAYKGTVGARGTLLNINIRGINTLRINNSFPLIVVDGIPYESNLATFGMGMFNNINPNDIESVSVLKDAAAASIWGAQSGNGVIVITTKRGKFNSDTRIAVNSSVSIKQRPDLYYTKPMNTSDYIDLMQFFFDKGRYNSSFNKWNFNTQPAIWMMKDARDGKITKEQLDMQLDALRSVDARDDYYKYIYREAITQSHNIQLTAGGDRFNTIFSAGYDKDKKSLVTNSYDRLSLKANSQFRPVKNLLLNMGLNYVESNNVWNLDDIQYRTLRNPYIRLADDQGNPIAVDVSTRNPAYRDTVAGGRLLSWEHYPLKETQASKNYQKVKESIFNFSAQYSFDNGIKLNASYNYQQTSNPLTQYNSLESFATRNEINSYASYNPTAIKWHMPVGDFFQTSHWDSRVNIGRLNGEYNKRWNTDHEINLLVGYDVREVSTEMKMSQYRGFDPETGTSQPVAYGVSVPWWNGKLGNTTLTDYTNYNSLTNRFTSYYANGSYTYQDRYILSGSFRKDASNLFGVKTNDRGQPFWSVGGAWLLSRESFVPETFDLLKLRVTYGYNGNVNNSIAAYPIIAMSSIPNSITGQNYATMKSPPNPTLRWERVQNTNFGLDFALLQNRISGSIEYYHKYTTDIISNAPVDPTTGFSTLSTNYGDIKNRGWDISLNTVSVKNSVWSIHHNLVFAYSRPRMTKAYTDPNTLSFLYMAGPYARIMTPFEGMDVFSLLTHRWAGLDPADGSPRAYLNGEVSKDYSKIIATEVTGLQNHGSTSPTYFGSFCNSVRFKNIELSFNLAYHLGYKMINESFDNDLFLNYDAKHSDYSLRWQKPGDELITDVPAFTYPNNALASQVYRNSSVLVESADFIKLRDIQCSLQLPMLAKYGFKNCRLYGYFQNVALLWRANKRNIDPEYGQEVPDPRMYSLGLNFNL